MKNKPRILIIDDSAMILGYAQLALGNEYEVFSFTEPEEAFRMLDNGLRVNAAIVDLKLENNVSGLDVIKQLKEKYSVKVNILFSSYDQKYLNEYSMTSGIPCVSKSSIDYLPEVVRNELALSELSEETARLKVSAVTPFADYLNQISLASRSLNKETEVLSYLCQDGTKVRSSVYQSESDPDKIVVSNPTCDGCSIGCLFCRTGRKKKYKRNLTKAEQIALIGHGLVNSYMIGLNAFKPNSKKRVAIYLAGKGDGLVYNLKNCCSTIEEVLAISKMDPRFVNIVVLLKMFPE